MKKGISLHIGIDSVDPNHYDGWSGPLNACVFDADAMELLAKGRGFGTHRLITEQATRSAVREHLLRFANELTAGDKLLLTYSGHGGFLPDDNDDELDGEDETWCLYDGQLVDDELYQIYSAFAPGVRVVVLSDSCHSGTVTKATFQQALARTGAIQAMLPEERQPANREMPRAVARSTYFKHRTFYDAIQSETPVATDTEVRAGVLLISGCQDNQTSLDGTFNGQFTGTLLRVWNKGKFDGDYASLHGMIVKRMPPTQTPNLYEVGRRDVANLRAFAI